MQIGGSLSSHICSEVPTCIRGCSTSDDYSIFGDGPSKLGAKGDWLNASILPIFGKICNSLSCSMESPSINYSLPNSAWQNCCWGGVETPQRPVRKKGNSAEAALSAASCGLLLEVFSFIRKYLASSAFQVCIQAAGSIHEHSSILSDFLFRLMEWEKSKGTSQTFHLKLNFISLFW